jgi:hypothetical protein
MENILNTYYKYTFSAVLHKLKSFRTCVHMYISFQLHAEYVRIWSSAVTVEHGYVVMFATACHCVIVDALKTASSKMKSSWTPAARLSYCVLNIGNVPSQHRRSFHWPVVVPPFCIYIRGTLYPQKLAITSPTSGGRSVGMVRSRTQTMEFYIYIYICVWVCVCVCFFVYVCARARKHLKTSWFLYVPARSHLETLYLSTHC